MTTRGSRSDRGDRFQLRLLLTTICLHSVWPMTAFSGSPPSNDLFIDRIQLSGLPAVTNGSNLDAARQSGEPNYFVDVGGSFATYQPVWYSWTAQTSGQVSIVATMPQHRALIAAFTGDSLSNLGQVSTM